MQQINRNIELMRYRYFGDQLLLLELVNAQSAAGPAANGGGAVTKKPQRNGGNKTNSDKSQAERLTDASTELKALFDELCDFTEQLGDEVQRKELKLYTAFKRIKNFVSIVVLPTKKDPRLLVYLKLPGDQAADDGFSRDVRKIGHWGTGDFELHVRSAAELEQVKVFITKSYEVS